MNVSVVTEFDRTDTTVWQPKPGIELNKSSNLKAIEFELALGTEDLRANGFAACLEQAARDSGFEILFNIPSTDGQPWQRLAAVGTIDDGEAIMVFVALSDSGNLIEIQPDLTDAPHLQAFAEAYFQLMFCQSTDRAAMAD